MNNNTADQKFNDAEPLEFSSTERAQTLSSSNGNLIDVNGWYLYVHEARRLRDWLNEVLP